MPHDSDSFDSQTSPAVQSGADGAGKQSAAKASVSTAPPRSAAPVVTPAGGDPGRNETPATPGGDGALADQQYLRGVLDQALDAVVMMNQQGQIVEWNPQAEAIFGWTREEAVGQTLAELIIPAGYREAHEKGCQHFLKTGLGPLLNQRVELPALRRDGHEVPVELTVTAVRLGQEFMFSAFVRDITARKRYEAQLARRALEAELLHRAAVLAAEANSFQEALQGCVDIVCQMTGWPVGHVYVPDELQQRLVPTTIWRLDRERHEQFRLVTEQTYLPRGVGLPGRIWQSGRPEWISNLARDHNFPRAQLCDDVDLRSGFGFPIQIEGRAVAILEFFSHDEVPVDPDLLTIVRSVGQQMGRVIERKQGEEQRARLAAIVQSSQDAIIGATLEGTITTWNQGAERMYGYTSDEVVGQPLQTMTTSSEHDELARHLQRLRRGETIEPFETIGVTKDRRRLDVMLSTSPVVDAGGRVIGISAIGRNITERKRVERALAEQARLATLRADIASALAKTEQLRPQLQHCCQVLVDHLEVAFARIWTLGPGDVLELQASAGMYTHLDGAHSRIQCGQFKIGRIAQTRQPHLTNDVLNDPHVSDRQWAQREGMIAFAGYPLVIEDRTVGVMATFARRHLDDDVLRDLHSIAHTVAQCIDRKRAEESLRQAIGELREKNEEMEQFVYTVSHDLKSPLVTITGFIGLLGEHLHSGQTEKIEHYSQRIKRSAERMSELIDHLLELSRIGRVQGTTTNIDVGALLHELQANLQSQLEQAQATLVVQEPLPHVQADRARLSQVFENLINNAIKYGCPKPGMQIRVGATLTPESLQYYVQDQGPGIAREFHDRIFGLFQRLDSRQEGTGVGLAIVAKIMKVQGGQVWVESAPGAGCTFHVAFPRALLVPSVD